ncbi:rab-GTPase-TBC domain-containing protein [Syncephalis pseudoplumigaleata]|uniref:Rab-GTPase-TBC domain-containing protein n=1 Tax=Syncephalis pseudoplumigaleata TaxID=1712513 RepID=A0A4P9Z6J6_9FUNG|nr:rab-GTPase-TBC domain-containing protein [Syncephalis pseudoplumigaleata]|eukprot:RKP27471.1 rab-GTPase-TBC domain-containing protein [Syncephalis pseudoplumigaleata]
MANNNDVEEFEDIMSAEVLVDMEKLRDMARSGVPNAVRGVVWRYLLGVESADRSREQSDSRRHIEEYEQLDKENLEISKRVRGDVQRYQRRLAAQLASFAQQHDLAAVVERILAAYINGNKHVEYSPALVSLCMPFVFVCQAESDMYHCFSRLMGMLEEVDVNEWATSWLQYLLSKELPLPCLLRLWDMYFSLDGNLENHVYVSDAALLALLRHYKDALEELEQSEIRTLLLRMPMLDIDEVIHQALNIRSEILQRQVSDAL